jgi:DHA2 family multidrug resistance protein
VFTRHTQIAWNQLVGFISPYNANVAAYLEQTHLNLNSAQELILLQGELAKQATMLAMVNIFIFIMMSFLVMLPFIFLLKYNKKQ